MGYYTEYNGEINISPAIDAETAEKFNNWLSQRHMPIDVSRLDMETVENNILPGCLDEGPDGVYFIYADSRDEATSDNPTIIFPEVSVRDHNDSGILPSLWSDLLIDPDASTIYWNGCDKSYEIPAWLNFIGECFGAIGYVMNGSFDFQGEREEDRGLVIVEDNRARIEYDDGTEYWLPRL